MVMNSLKIFRDVTADLEKMFVAESQDFFFKKRHLSILTRPNLV